MKNGKKGLDEAKNKQIKFKSNLGKIKKEEINQSSKKRAIQY